VFSGNDDVTIGFACKVVSGNDDVAIVIARKVLSGDDDVTIVLAWSGFWVMMTFKAVSRITRPSQLSLRTLLLHFIRVESQSKLSGHEKEKFEFDLRNLGSRDAA